VLGLVLGILAAATPASSAGAATGPILVKDINPGSGSGAPDVTTNVNGTLFFSASDGTHGTELWESDGTGSGTTMVKDVRPGSTSSLIVDGSDNPIPVEPADVNGTVFFVANDGEHGFELWKSDGTAAGTRLVEDIRPGRGGSAPIQLTGVNGTLYFSASDGTHGYEPWKSDGTATGTKLVKDIKPGSGGSYSGGYSGVGGKLMFGADDGTHGLQPWRSDGTPAGTQMVKDINAGGSFPRDFTNVGGTLFFAAWDAHGYELWKSDGTTAGTKMVRDIDPSGSSYPSGLTDLNGTLLFAASDGAHGGELWRSDGSEAGTSMVEDIESGPGYSVPSYLTTVNGVLFFDAYDSAHGDELWRSDGTEAGTSMVADVNTGPNGSILSGLTNVDGTLMLSGDNGASGNELWRSDGSQLGTTMVKNINPGAAGSSPRALIDVSGTLFFTADDGAHGRELWKYSELIVDPPRITGTAPTSPGHDSNPKVKGVVGAGSPTQVKLYGHADCAGSPMATGTVVAFTGAGIAVPVTPNSTTSISAKAFDSSERASPCSNSLSYVEDSMAPDTDIDSGPEGATNDPTPTFAFHSTERGSTFACRIDSAPYAPCNSPRTAAHLDDGSHVFYVRSTDAAGNPDSTPAVRSFTVRTASIAFSYPRLVVSAAAGAQDRLMITKPSATTLRITDLGGDGYDGSGVHAGGRCTRSNDYTAICDAAGATRIIVYAGDQADYVDNETSIASELWGGDGGDRLSGGAGPDAIVGGIGRDRMHGKEGDDSIYARDDADDPVIDCGPGIDHAWLDGPSLIPALDTTAFGCETKARK
jgi:ELWxxDGT repeat protein